MDWKEIKDWVVMFAGLGWLLIGLLIKSKITDLKLEVVQTMSDIKLDTSSHMASIKLELTKNQMDTVGALDAHLSSDEIMHGDIKRRLDSLETWRARATDH